MNNDDLLVTLKELVDANRRTIEYGDQVVDTAVIYRFILEHMGHEE